MELLKQAVNDVWNGISLPVHREYDSTVHSPLDCPICSADRDTKHHQAQKFHIKETKKAKHKYSILVKTSAWLTVLLLAENCHYTFA